MKNRNLVKQTTHCLAAIAIGIALSYHFAIFDYLIFFLDLPIVDISGDLLGEVFFGVYLALGIILFLIIRMLKIGKQFAWYIVGITFGVGSNYLIIDALNVYSDKPAGLFVIPVVIATGLWLFLYFFSKEKVENEKID